MSRTTADYGNKGGNFHAAMLEQERRHAQLDYHKAREAKTDAAMLAWVAKWGDRVVDNLWSIN